MTVPSRAITTALTELVPRSMPSTAPRSPVEARWDSGMVITSIRGMARQSRDDDDLVCGRVRSERVKGLAVVVEPEAMGDDAVRLRPAGTQRGDGRAERGDLREGALDGDLSAEDVERV